MQKHNKYEQIRQKDTSKGNNSTVTDIKDSEEESPDEEFRT
jgi:hypothetical protein